MSVVDFPLTQLVTTDSGASNRWFAREAVQHVPASVGVLAEVTDDGLLLRAITEVDLEVACHAVIQRYPDARVHKPQLRYIEGPPLQEPYYRILIATPEDNLGDVAGDLTSRRAQITMIEDDTSGKRISAEIPVGECFGYGTQLRFLTRGRGTHQVEFIGYRPCWPLDGGAPTNVA